MNNPCMTTVSQDGIVKTARRRWRWSFVPVVAAAALIAGCGSSSSTATKSKAGTTLTIAMPQFPPTLDPALGDNAYSNFMDLAYDPLIVKKSDGSYVPGLAKSWEYGPENRSFTIHLRSGVKFSDGSPLTAQTVKDWIKHMLDYPGGTAPGYLKSLKSMNVTDPLTLRLNFDAPTPLLELVFSQFLMIGDIGNPKAAAANKLKNGTVGAGQYMLDRAQTVPRDHYTYVPNPHYWNKSAVHWKKIVIKVIQNPNAALSALRTNQAQVAEVQPITGAKAAKAAGLKVTAPLVLLMGLSLTDREGEKLKPLGDVRVRQALNYAVDREALSKLLGAGYGRPTAQMAVPGDDAYDPALDKAYPYDPAKAKQLLAAAGYPNGFTLSVASLNLAQQDTVAQALTSQLKKIGVTLKANIMTSVGDYTNALGGKSYQAATLSWGRLPAVINHQLLWGPNAAGSNPYKTTSPELEAIYKRLIAASSEEAPAIAREMQRYLVKEAWFLPVAATPLAEFVRPEIAGVEATAQRSIPYAVEYKPRD